MNVIKYNVNSGDVCQIGRQYEYGKTQVIFEGYQVIDSANEIYFKFIGRTEESKYLIPIVDMTLDITQQLTKHVGQFSCQLEEMNTGGTLVSQSPVFYVAVKRSIKVGADYEVQEPRLETIYQKYNEMYNIISQTNETSLANESQRQAEWLTLKQEVSDAIDSFNADIAIGEFRTLVQTETDNFNTNAETKLNAYNQNDSQKTNAYNTNAESKLTAYNENDVAKTRAYNTNASNKVTEYNTNANNRVAEFDTHTEQIQTDISELKSDLSDLQDISVGNLIDGGFVTSNGDIGINQYYSYTDFIKIYPAKKIKLNMCFESNSSVGIAFYTKPTDYKDFVSFVKNDGEIGNAQVVDVPIGAKYVRITHKNSVAQEQYLKLVDLFEIAENADEALNIAKSLHSVDSIYRKVYEDVDLIKSLVNGYVKDDGTFSTNDSLRRTDYIDVSNLSKVYFKGIMYWQYYAFYREDKTFLGGKDQYGVWDYSDSICSIDVPTDAKYLIVSFSSAADAESGWGSARDTEPTGKVIYSSLEEYRDYSFSPTNPCDYTGDEICTFNKILCIGDSITQGVFNHNESGSVEYATIGKYSYPTYLGKITDVEVVNWGIGGDTSVDWWNEKQNEDFSGYDCCIINLGINDALKGTSIEDSRTAFTNILNAVKSANKNIKVFFATIVPAYAKGDSTYDNINTLIKEFATNENCYLVDLTEYSHCVKGGAYKNGHLTALGYHRLAHDYKAYISFIMNQNPESFKWVQFIGTDMKQN